MIMATTAETGATTAATGNFLWHDTHSSIFLSTLKKENVIEEVCH